MSGTTTMNRTRFSCLTWLATLALPLPAMADFVGDSHARLELRNHYINRDFRQSNAPQAKAEEWGQGFTARLESGFTEGPVGVGVDAMGQLGVKLDSSRDRRNTGLLPFGPNSHEPVDDYSELGLTGKVRVSKSTLRLGTLQPILPVVVYNDTRLLDDLADMVECTRARLPPGLPLVLLGHSMGGLVAARFVAMHLRPIDALVLSSPALDPGLNAVQKLLLATLPRFAPNLRVGNGLDAQYLSHDPAVPAAYLADPLCHDRISARLARFIADGGPATVARAAHWSVPTLLIWAGGDKLVNPAGSRAFAAAARRASSIGKAAWST